MKTWITADHHFGHKSVLKFEPTRLWKKDSTLFRNIYEHDQFLIERWNSIISTDDLVYYLGDFAYQCNKLYAETIFWQLNGTKILIAGNHDHNIAKKFTNCWNEIHELLRIQITKENGHKRGIIMGHRQFLSWEINSCDHIHGHCHGSTPNSKHRFDCGIDTNNGYPYL